MSTVKKYLKTKVKVTFEVAKEAALGAKEVYLLCDFNGWDPIPLVASKAKKKEGSYSLSIDLPIPQETKAFQYRFRFVMPDGSEKYDNDWNAEKYCPNPFGGENSVFTVVA
ncbi:MAG: isoamylase early set domain-containing protein [Succinivibrionaceae bacterium]|nr:isoamylase early set domain-containing protein [Ruminobacter sp.]MDY5779635.1 isoamylase early set domain-containing protein [Succinivibrionaceae bacterium]MEE1339182.1 isoamylase early set domain-containing protein [Succinivibrionaceae bacterium]